MFANRFVCERANLFSSGGSNETFPFLKVTFPVVEPTSAKRNGKRPVLHLEQSRCEETQAVIQLLHQLRQSSQEYLEERTGWRYEKSDRKYYPSEQDLA
jgi:hypothetical protein